MYQGKSINSDFQAAMEEMFHEYGVDIYFSGHVHSYERDYPVSLPPPPFSSVPYSSGGVSWCGRSQRLQ
jgi:hypothetical protein